MDNYNITTTIEKIREALNDEKLDANYKELLCMFGNDLIQKLNCSICNKERSEVVSLGMLFFYCDLDRTVGTRTYNENCLNLPICPDNCPIKKMKFQKYK